MCITPLIRKKKFTGENVPVPCGRCPECIARRTSGWSFRLMEEDKRAFSALFVTLTYDTDHVPITKKGYMTLCKRCVQLFFKRLRKLEPNMRLKYYVAGEYGSERMRPHYHIILFNARESTVRKAWQKGDIDCGTVTGASIGYVLKYMCKEKKIPLHRNDDRIPEFSLMSKGLGKSYLTDEMVKWHHEDINNRMYCNVENKKITMPRYYKNKIYTDLERDYISRNQVDRAREKKLEEEKKLKEDYGDDWEKIKVERHKHLFRLMFNKAEKNRNKI